LLEEVVLAPITPFFEHSNEGLLPFHTKITTPIRRKAAANIDVFDDNFMRIISMKWR
jgi:hypothetical protein